MDAFKMLALFLAVTMCTAEKYPVTVEHDGETYEGLVEVNVNKGEEIYKTGYTVPEDGSESKTGLYAPYTVRDVNKKVDAVVDEEKNVCYLSVYDANDEVSPVDLKSEMESSSAKKVEESKTVTKLEGQIVEDPITDVASVSSVVASHCADKTSYWTLVTKEETTCDGVPCEEEIQTLDARGICLSWGFEWRFKWEWRCLFGSCNEIRVRFRAKVCVSFG